VNGIGFKNWLESQVLGGGLEPPKQNPVDPDPGKGQSIGAWNDVHTPGSDQLPPVKRKKKIIRR